MAIRRSITLVRLISASSDHAHNFLPELVALVISGLMLLGLWKITSYFRASETRASQLEITNNISRMVSSTLVPDELFRTIADEIRRVVPCDRIIIGSHDMRKMTVQNFHEDGDSKIGPPQPIIFERGLIVQDLYEKKCLINIPDLQNGKWRETRHAKHGYRSVLTIPILQEEQCIAHLFLASWKLGGFTKMHEELLTSVSSHLGAAIRNASLYQKSETHTARLQITENIAKAAGSSLEPNELFKKIAGEIRQAVPCDKIVIATHSEETVRRFHEEGGEALGPPSEENFRRGVMGQEVYKTKQPLNVPDIQNSRWRENRHAKQGYRSVVAVPILQENQYVAHMILSRKKTEPFSQAQEDLLISVASHLGPAIRNATLYEESQDYTAQLCLLGDLAHELSSHTDPSSIFEMIGRAGREVLKADRCAINKMDSDGAQKMAWHFGLSDRFLEAAQARIDIRAVHAAVRTSSPIFIPDAPSDERTAPMHDMIREEGYRSVLHLPLRGSENGFGTVSYYFDEIVSLPEHLIETAQTFADQAAAAIEKAQLFEESQRRADRLAVLNQITQRISEYLSLDEVLASISDAVMKLFQGDHTRIYLLDEPSGEFVLRANSGIPVPVSRHRIQAGIGLTGVTIRLGEPNLINNIPDAGDPTHPEWTRENGLHSFLGHPLKKNGKVIGAITCVARQANFFTEEDMELLGALASQARVAIENAALYGESEKRGKRLAALVNISQRLTRELDLANVLESISKASAALFEGEAGFRLLQGNQLVRQGVTPGAMKMMSREKISIGTPIAGLVAQTGEPFISESTGNDPRIAPEIRQKEDFPRGSATLCVPLLAGSRILGTLGIFREQGYVFGREEVQLATSLANQAAVAIENASLHAEAKRSRNFFRSVVDDNADAIFVTDKESRIILWNDGAVNLYGYAESEAIGQDVGDLIISHQHNENWSTVRKHLLESLFQDGKSSRKESTHRKKDGTIIPIDVTQSPVRNEDGEIIAICAICKDLTERKEAEEKLLQAKNDAEAASLAKSDFLSTVSHELRSPLNAVIGFSDLILKDEGVKDEITLQLVPKVQNAGKQLLLMIEELLDHDRIEQGKVVLNPESISINNLIIGTVDSWQARLSDKYSLTCELDSPCGLISCDSTRISQVLNNLIDNAIKYSPDGGAILVTTLATPDEVRISIRDEGLGMSPEETAMVFERFHQLDSGYTHRAGGLGIGLSLVQKLVEIHGGRIWMESTQGEGSTCTFTLPRIASLKTEPTGQEQGDGAKEPFGQGDPWTGRNILVVDDLEHYHEYMKLLMRSADRLSFAFNGLEAIELARRENPDLILMDLRMPVMNGFEAIERLKSDPTTKNIPIVAVTAQAMEEDNARAALAGANGFISKPIDMEVFGAEIGRVLGVRV